ncbi:hypothetical protein OIU34_19145 [Pararhizobium sp. BT-229]|uniref:hypothetical protein n=1 Tax=Pararhizobium sp. BT-229 TaxID=2986923 RepID=UPI0021F7EEB1|nr:hypothetical protein [Pararhizobium sp. BT-229]MCV9963999.1 hypothetical protein [Pararhizobium sp. BT-229]
MSSRHVGFSTKDAVASIMGAFREKHGEERRPSEPGRTGAKAIAVHIADLPSGRTIHELAGDGDLQIETSGWRLGLSEQAAMGRARGGQRALSIRSQNGDSEFVILVDTISSAVVAVVSQLGATPCLPSPGHVGRALVAKGISFNDHLYRFSAIRDKGGRNHFLDSCPDRVELGVDTYVHSSDPAVLPKVLVADGDFNLIDTAIARNAVSANVSGSLGLRNLTGLVVPSHLNVGVDLLLQMSDADRLPMRFSVGRDLDIGLTRITELPSTFHVGRHIVANGASICRLKGGMTVRGNFDLRGCPISEVPWGLEVGGDLNLSGTGIKAIPGDTAIGGNLMVEEGVSVPSTVRLGGVLMYARPYGYETVRRPSN